MNRRRWVALGLAGVLALGGSWQVGEGLYIHLKAALAQVLLQNAWRQTEAGTSHARPWPWADTWPVARLAAPAFGIDIIVLEGASGRTLAFGPGHVAGSAAPGGPGTSIITGHRDTHFRFLERLAPGDELIVEAPGAAPERYVVRKTRVADYRRPAIALPAAGSRLVLATCYPFDSPVPGGPLRYIVEAEAATDHPAAMP